MLHPLPSLAALATSCLFCTAAPVAAQVPMLRIFGDRVGTGFGHPVAAAGDVDRDGIGDVIIGMPGDAGGVGAARVCSGRDGRVIRELTGDPAKKWLFGAFVGAAGDVDRDGTPDLIVSSLTNDSQGVNTGQLQILSGRTGGRLFVATGSGAGDYFGISAANVGDLDGDGYPDLVVGAPENGDPIQNYGNGYARVFSGRTGTALRTISGVSVGDEFGTAVAAAGDVDRDGTPDFVVGSTLEGRGLGSARVYSGRTFGVIQNFPAHPLGACFGMSVGGGGDVDADGYPDVIVGAVNINQPIPSAVWVFSGRTGQKIHEIPAAPSYGMAGMNVGHAGDIDNDGHADFWSGFPMDSTLRPMGGSVRYYSGKDGSELMVLYGTGSGTGFGMSAANLGDLNGDGRVEVAVGASMAGRSGQPLGMVVVFSLAAVAATAPGCAAGSAAPTLDAGHSVIGKRTRVFLRASAGGQTGLLFLSAIPEHPLPLSPGCNMYLDPGLLLPVSTLRSDASGRWSAEFRVPRRKSLIGGTFALQALLGTARGAGFELTNGVYALIGG